MPTGAPKQPVLFQAELRPNASGTLKAAHRVVLVLFCACVPIGLGFMLAGAWPVFGFMGLELLLLYVALRLSLKRGDTVEHIAVTNHQLTVERINPWGQRQRWSFLPQLLRVDMTSTPGTASPLILSSPGEKLTIGAFLSADERLQLARALNKALKGIPAVSSPLGA